MARPAPARLRLSGRPLPHPASRPRGGQPLLGLAALLVPLVPLVPLVIAGCAHPRGASTSAASDPDRVPFSADLRAAELRTLARTIEEGYAHLAAKQAEWGVDLPRLVARYEPAARAADTWGRYEVVMVSFVSELHDAHLTWRRPRAPGERRRKIARLGLASRFVGDELVVSEVWPGSAVERAQVVVGDRIAAIDGQAVERRLEEHAALRAWSRRAAARYDFGDAWPAARYDAGATPAARELTLQRDDRFDALRIQPETAPPPGRAPRPPMAVERLAESRPGDPPGATAPVTVLRLRSLRELVTPRRLDELGAELLAAAPAPGPDGRPHPAPLIVDLRDNSGGYEHQARELVGRLSAHPVTGARLRVRLTARTRAERAAWGKLDEDPALPGWSTLQPVTAEPRAPRDHPGPIAVLVDAGCRSSCETLALLLRAMGARLFGETTGGSSGAPVTYVMPWSQARVTIPAWELYDLAGQPVEGRGVIPDEEIAPTRADLIGQRDAPLERARAWALSPPPGESGAGRPAR